MYLPGSQTSLDGFSERMVSMCDSQNGFLDGGWWRLKLCPTEDSRKDSSISSGARLRNQRNNHAPCTNIVQAQGLYREIYTQRCLCVSTHQAYFCCVIATSKCTISLWASRINRKKNSPNGSQIPRDQVRSKVDLDFLTSSLGSQLLPRGLTSY